MQELNIVELIESNPISKLSGNYNGKMLSKIQSKFTDFEQQLFISSFYCYLNYDQTKDFVIDFDNVWKWLGFSVKIKAKIILEKHFTINVDYIKSLSAIVQQTNHIKGGHNKEIFMLTVKAFKSFCLKACTKKADEVHEYFLKLEGILHEVVQEENSELKQQLENHVTQSKQQLENHVTQSKKDQEALKLQLEMQGAQSLKEKEQLLEDTLISQFPINTQCIYYGKIDNKTLGKASRLHNESLIKFGQSNNLAERIKCHKKNFINFRLVAAFKVKNKIEIENAIKRHPVLKKQLRILTVDAPDFKNENYREMLALDNDSFTIEKVDEYIKEIIRDNEYNIENYNLLVEKNIQLEEQLRISENAHNAEKELTKKLTVELQNYKSDVTSDNQKRIAGSSNVCKYSYLLYAFWCGGSRYKCSIMRQKDCDQLTFNLKHLDPCGEMKYFVKVSHTFTEKIMSFLLKKTLTSVGVNVYESSFENIKKTLDISLKIEEILDNNCKDLDKLSDILNGSVSTSSPASSEDPEVPLVRKSKRSIDQINKDTDEIIKTYESIEQAGRSLGISGSAIGIALREKRLCQGFLWRYTGISKEDQYKEQPVTKICCTTGEHTYFNTIADAAKDCGISPPGLRARIFTHVHHNDHHWTFSKGATHCSK